MVRTTEALPGVRVTAVCSFSGRVLGLDGWPGLGVTPETCEGAVGVAQLVERLPNIREALGLIPCTA